MGPMFHSGSTVLERGKLGVYGAFLSLPGRNVETGQASKRINQTSVKATVGNWRRALGKRMEEIQTGPGQEETFGLISLLHNINHFSSPCCLK